METAIYTIKDFLRDMEKRHSQEGFSKSSFAEKCGLHDSTGRKWASGASHPSAAARAYIRNYMKEYYPNDLDIFEKMDTYYHANPMTKKLKKEKIIKMYDIPTNPDFTYIDEEGDECIVPAMKEVHIEHKTFELLYTKSICSKTFYCLLENDYDDEVCRGYIYTKEDADKGMIKLFDLPKKFLYSNLTENMLLSMANHYIFELNGYDLLEKPLLEANTLLYQRIGEEILWEEEHQNDLPPDAWID